MIRLIIASVLFVVSLFVVVSAPVSAVWPLEVAATEWGWILMLLAIGVFAPGWRATRKGWSSVAMAVVTILLAAQPILQARSLAEGLPDRLQSAFPGLAPASSMPDAPALDVPFSVGRMIMGVGKVDVRRSSHRFAARQADLSLELFRPATEGGPWPGVVIIHGGSWSGGSRLQYERFSQYLAARGYVVASIDYSLAPAHVFPTQAEDVASAIAWLEQQGRSLDLDPRRIALVGRSSGAQLALLAAYQGRDPSIRGVVSFYGPTDLEYGYANPTNPRILDSRHVLESFLGGPPSTQGALYRGASPVTHVRFSSPPTLLIHGGRDEMVHAVHSEMLAERLSAQRRPHLLLSMPWATHSCDANLSGPCGQLSLYAVERFLATVLSQP